MLRWMVRFVNQHALEFLLGDWTTPSKLSQTQGTAELEKNVLMLKFFTKFSSCKRDYAWTGLGNFGQNMVLNIFFVKQYSTVKELKCYVVFYNYKMENAGICKLATFLVHL